MALNIYDEVIAVNKRIYTDNVEEYWQRTKDGHANYLGNFIEMFLSNLKGPHIYDLGCGPGRDLKLFHERGFDAWGVDCSPGMVKFCQDRNLTVVQNDFISMNYVPNSVDGFWAYTSHTVIPKEDFSKLMQKYSIALKKDDGILALGMIEGNFEGWKSDAKYNGTNRFVARYTAEELEFLLGRYFGTVSIWREKVNGKVYLHCLCRNTPVANKYASADAARALFDKYSQQYLENTQTGIELLRVDRENFAQHILYNATGKKIIDIGCGPGRDLLIFSQMGFDPIGLDISEVNVESCKTRGLQAMKGDIYSLGDYFTENVFDGAWCNCSITNWILKAELPKVLQDLKKIVKPGGIIFVGSVLGNFSGWEIDQKYDRLKRYNNHWREEELRRLIAPLGKLLGERKLTNTGKKDYLNLVYKNEK